MSGGNHREDLIVSAARVATPADVAITMREECGIIVAVEVTAQGGATDVRPTIMAPGPTGQLGVLYQADGTHNVTGIGTFFYYMYPMGLEAANTELAPAFVGAGANPGGVRDRISISIPQHCTLRMVHNTATSSTYAVRVYYLP